jgi:hypothetical protein
MRASGLCSSHSRRRYTDRPWSRIGKSLADLAGAVPQHRTSRRRTCPPLIPRHGSAAAEPPGNHSIVKHIISAGTLRSIRSARENPAGALSTLAAWGASAHSMEPRRATSVAIWLMSVPAPRGLRLDRFVLLAISHFHALAARFPLARPPSTPVTDSTCTVFREACSAWVP